MLSFFILTVYGVLGLVDIFKSGGEWSHMREFMYTVLAQRVRYFAFSYSLTLVMN